MVKIADLLSIPRVTKIALQPTDAMNDILKTLIGQRIDRAKRVLDYIQFHFANGDVLNIYNDWEFFGDPTTSLEIFDGCELADICCSETALEMSTKTGFGLRSDLRDEAYKGPEALEHIPKNGLRFVWN